MLRDLNWQARAACCADTAGIVRIAADLFRIIGRRATRTTWSSAGDPAKEFVKWSGHSAGGGARRSRSAGARRP